MHFFARAACSSFIRLLEKNGFIRPASHEQLTHKTSIWCCFFTRFARKKREYLGKKEQNIAFPFPDGPHPKNYAEKKLSVKFIYLRVILKNMSI